MPINKVNNNIKLKSAGGILNSANGLEVDTSIYPQGVAMPAYESLVAGDLLKTINDSGVYKLKKIVGFKTSFQDGTKNIGTYDISQILWLDTNKVILVQVVDATPVINLYVGTINGETLTVGNVLASGFQTSGTHKAYDIIRVDSTRFIMSANMISGSNFNILARVFTVSGTTISGGTIATVSTAASATYFNGSNTPMCMLDASRVAILYFSMSNNRLNMSILSLVGDVITVGSLQNSNLFGNVSAGRMSIVKINTNKVACLYSDMGGSGATVLACTISGDIVTWGTSYVSATAAVCSSVSIQAGLENFSNDKVVLLYLVNATTFNIQYISASGTTLTSNAIVGKTITSVDHTTIPIQYKKENNNLYVTTGDTASNILTLLKFTIDEVSRASNYSFIKGSIIPAYDNFRRCNRGIDLVNNDRMMFTNVNYSTNYPMVQTGLIDHNEFITSANASYSAGASVPIVSTMTGFTGLSNGVDYYINSDATGLTQDSTYQKVGKAINATTIIK